MYLVNILLLLHDPHAKLSLLTRCVANTPRTTIAIHCESRRWQHYDLTPLLQVKISYPIPQLSTQRNPQQNYAQSKQNEYWRIEPPKIPPKPRIMLLFPNPAIVLPLGCANAPPAPDSPTKSDLPLSIRPDMTRNLSWDLVSLEEGASPGSTRSSAQASRCASPPAEDEELVEIMTEVVCSREDGPLDVSQLPLSSPSSSKSPSPCTSPPPSPILSFDTSAFPPHAHLFPSSPNGTWRNKAAHTLKSPHTIDSGDLREKLMAFVEDVSDGVTTKLNSICEGKDLPAMHDKAMGYLPKMKVPDRRNLEKVVEKGWEAGVEVWSGKKRSNVGEGMGEWVDMGGEWDVGVMMKKK